MGYTSKLIINGTRHNLATEWIGEALTLSIALETPEGQRKQIIRIPLSDYDLNDLLMFSSYLNAFISSLDPHELYALDAQDDDGMSDEGLTEEGMMG